MLPVITVTAHFCNFTSLRYFINVPRLHRNSNSGSSSRQPTAYQRKQRPVASSVDVLSNRAQIFLHFLFGSESSTVSGTSLHTTGSSGTATSVTGRVRQRNGLDTSSATRRQSKRPCKNSIQNSSSSSSNNNNGSTGQQELLSQTLLSGASGLSREASRPLHSLAEEDVLADSSNDEGEFAADSRSSSSSEEEEQEDGVERDVLDDSSDDDE